MLAHRWNLETLQLEGEPVSIAEDVRSGGSNGRNAFAHLRERCACLSRWRHRRQNANQLVHRATVSGRRSRPWQRGNTVSIALSPDDRHLVVVSGNGDDRDLWLKDLTTGAYSRLDHWRRERRAIPSGRLTLVASPTQERISSGMRYFETLIGSGQAHSDPGWGIRTCLEDWTDDGKYLVARGGRNGEPSNGPSARDDSSKSNDTPQKILEVPYTVDQVRVSPDGKWVAYTSFESGQQPEINVAAFPGFTDRRQISSGSDPGAVQPLWRATARSCSSWDATAKLMAVDVMAGATLANGTRPGVVRDRPSTPVRASARLCRHARREDGSWSASRLAAKRRRSNSSTW